MIIHDRTRLTGRLIPLICILVFLIPLPVSAYGPTDEEVFYGMLSLDAFPSPDYEIPDLERSVDAMRVCSVQVHAGATYGSGCIYSVSRDELIVVTNRHVLATNKVVVQLYEGTGVSGEVIGLSDEFDVGFVRVPLGDVPYDLRIRLHCLKLENSFVPVAEEHDRIFAYASSDFKIADEVHEGEVIYPSAYIEQFASTMLFAKCLAEAGMSGGGLFDSHGRFLGLVTGGNDLGEMICVRAVDVLMAASEVLYEP